MTEALDPAAKPEAIVEPSLANLSEIQLSLNPVRNYLHAGCQLHFVRKHRTNGLIRHHELRLR